MPCHLLLTLAHVSTAGQPNPLFKSMPDDVWGNHERVAAFRQQACAGARKHGACVRLSLAENAMQPAVATLSVAWHVTCRHTECQHDMSHVATTLSVAIVC